MPIFNITKMNEKRDSVKSMENNVENKKRICFVCDTPLQIINCINIVRNHYDLQKYIVDVYLGYAFRDAEKISRNLKKCEWIGHVYDFESFLHISGDFVLRVLSLINPRYILKKFNKNQLLEFHSYEKVFINMFNYFTRTVILSVEYQDICIYEDGIGTYIGTTFRDEYIPLIVKIFDKMFLRNKLQIRPREIHVSNPAFYKNDFETDVVQLENLDKHNMALREICSVFGYQDNNVYMKRKLIYLSQPLNDFLYEECIDIEKEVLDYISKKYVEDYLIRIHPRQTEKVYEEYVCDEMNNLWELECISQIDDNSIIISNFSTAAFIPAMFYGKKPYLLFLNKIFYHRNRNLTNDKDVMIEKLKTLYGCDDDKIVVPDDIQQVLEVIERWMCKVDQSKQDFGI